MGASLVAQMVKHLPAMQETQVRSLGQEDPLEKVATHSRTLAWRIHEWRSLIGGARGVTGNQTRLSDFTRTRGQGRKLLYRMEKQQALLCSTGNCAQYPEINHSGKECTYTCACN